MKTVKNLFILLAALALSPTYGIASNTDTIHFFPDKKVEAFLKITGQTVEIILKNNKNRLKKKTLVLDTEKKIHLETNDYNFDGATDFSLWYVSDGMGTYSIYRIFVFSKQNGDFIEISPKCGDEFINVKVDKIKRMLTNSYYRDNVITSCAAKY